MVATELADRARRRRPTKLAIVLIASAVVAAVVVVATVQSRVEGRGVLAECGSGNLVVRLDGADLVVVSLPWGYLYVHDRRALSDVSHDDVAHLGDPVIVKGTTLDGYGDPPPCSDVRYIKVESIVPA
jgi:hypothetical protein